MQIIYVDKLAVTLEDKFNTGTECITVDCSTGLYFRDMD